MIEFTQSDADDDFDDRYITLSKLSFIVLFNLVAAHSEINKAWGIIQPDNTYRAMWDLLCLLSIIY